MKSDTRKEHDSLGELEIPADYPFGIHTFRASRNFPLSNERIRSDLFRAVIEVKAACARANRAAGNLDERIAQLIEQACAELLTDIESFIPPIHPLQGGAGTSINMAANELVANRALALSGESYGRYDIISPLAHVNMSQSTNDVVPTAFRVALMRSLKDLHSSCERLLESLLEKEKEFSHILKIGRTEMQEAMPVTLGQEFGAYAEAVARFRWRLSKASEWIRDVNLSGSAVGTGINADRKYAAYAVNFLREITRENVSLARNLIDATQNTDALAECSSLVKTGAVAVKKICADLRLLSSGPGAGFAEIRLPAVQAGSSIMPGKVNPVICESVEQVCLSVMSADSLVASASSESNLELPQFLPLIAHTMLSHNELFSNALSMLARHVKGISADEKRIREELLKSPALATILSPVIGYEKSAEIVAASKREGRTCADIIIDQGILTRGELEALMKPEILASPGRIKAVDN
jgi:aspartate ammonia-lyase